MFNKNMRSINSEFYNSQEWRTLRAVYKREHPFCEICKAKGILKPTEHIHHKIWLNKNNINNPKIALNADNLQAVCHDCHNKIHFKEEAGKRFKVLPNGEVETL